MELGRDQGSKWGVTPQKGDDFDRSVTNFSNFSIESEPNLIICFTYLTYFIYEFFILQGFQSCFSFYFQFFTYSLCFKQTHYHFIKISSLLGRWFSPISGS